MACVSASKMLSAARTIVRLPLDNARPQVMDSMLSSWTPWYRMGISSSSSRVMEVQVAAASASGRGTSVVAWVMSGSTNRKVFPMPWTNARSTAMKLRLPMARNSNSLLSRPQAALESAVQDDAASGVPRSPP